MSTPANPDDSCPLCGASGTHGDNCDKCNDTICHTCDGQGVMMECCDSEDCPPNCPGHEVVCHHCNGTGSKA